MQIRHNPLELLDFSIQPIMFVLLFTYVFGGAIAGSTGAYLTFALPGIIVMNMLFVTMYVGPGPQHRPHQGRLRPAPLAADRPVGTAGRADHRRPGQAGVVDRAAARRRHDPRLPDRHQRGSALLGAVALLLVFALAFSWVSVLVGVLAKDPEKVQVFGFTALFPVTFVSNVFVPDRDHAGLAAAVGEGQPGIDPVRRHPWAAGRRRRRHPIIQSLLWAAAIAAVFAPLAVARFKRRV